MRCANHKKRYVHRLFICRQMDCLHFVSPVPSGTFVFVDLYLYLLNKIKKIIIYVLSVISLAYRLCAGRPSASSVHALFSRISLTAFL